MTKPQRLCLFSDWWPAACHAQGWRPDDRAFRLEKLSEIVGRPLASANDLNNTGDVSKVKTELLLLTKPTLANAVAAVNSVEENRRRGYLLAIAKFPRSYVAALPHCRAVGDRYEELDTDTLWKLMITLNERARAKKRQRLSENLCRAGQPEGFPADASVKDPQPIARFEDNENPF